MKKLKFITASAAIAALTLTACQNDVDFTQEDAQNAAAAAAALDDNAIQFGTYLNQNLATRAGFEGAITTSVLQDNTAATGAQGFGVFAYYTGTKTYGQYQKVTYTTESGSETEKHEANFMFNEQVKWNSSLGDGYITKWEYSPLKYWPNEVQSGTLSGNGVDDQENDTNGDNATTEYTKGGNVSFFAYAPYVTVGASTLDDEFKGAAGPATDATYGIIAINGATAKVTANAAKGDPTITYVVNPDGKKIVDLLWGTMGSTSLNVKNGGNTGVSGGSTSPQPEGATTYAGEVLSPYKTNADLTKQKTNGTVDFAFKHATSKVGGSTNTSTSAGASAKNGLMVVLDLDDLKGAEVGGAKDASTKVTVTSIQVDARTLVNDKKDGSGNNPGNASYTRTYLKKAQGDLNLATGKWTIFQGENDINDPASNLTTTAPTPTTQIINQDGTGANVVGQLNADIKEPATVTAWSSLDAVNGVETTAKNVYATETAPLVFIPGTYPELTVTIDYTVRTEDDNLAQGYSEVEQIITKRLTFTSPVELNKQYSILMHLGLTSVKFTASVSDWELNATPANFDSDGDGVNDIKVEDVYLPRNVGALMIKYAAPLTSAANASYAPATGTVGYYDGATWTPVSSDLAYVTTPTGGDAWVGALTATSGNINIAENTSYNSRTATFQIKYTGDGKTIYSDNITLTQPGKIPTEVNIAWTSGYDPDLASSKAATSGPGYTDYNYKVDGGKVTVKVTESDDTPASSQSLAPTDLFFIDDATGNKAAWITYTGTAIDGAFRVADNTSNAIRTATLYAVVGGKRVVVKSGVNNVKLTQSAN